MISQERLRFLGPNVTFTVSTTYRHHGPLQNASDENLISFAISLTSLLLFTLQLQECLMFQRWWCRFLPIFHFNSRMAFNQNVVSCFTAGAMSSPLGYAHLHQRPLTAVFVSCLARTCEDKNLQQSVFSSTFKTTRSPNGFNIFIPPYVV